MNMELGDTLAWAWPIILTVVAMPLISLINGLAGWSKNKKKATVLAVAFVLGVLYTVAAGLISEVPAEWSAYVTRALVIAAIIVVVTQAVYGFFKPVLDSIENAVSRGGDTSEQEAQARPADG